MQMLWPGNEKMICTKCNLEKPKHLFNKSSRHTSGMCPWCKVCESKRKTAWKLNNPKKAVEYAIKFRNENRSSVYAKNKEYEKNNHAAKLAKMAVRRAIIKGVLIRPKKCSLCPKKENIEAHHENYSKQLDVKWVCKSCHRKIHCGVELQATWSEKK